MTMKSPHPRGSSVSPSLKSKYDGVRRPRPRSESDTSDDGSPAKRGYYEIECLPAAYDDVSGDDVTSADVTSAPPAWLARCQNIRTFVIICCVAALVSGALVSGYVSSVITTIEKRFEIGSTASGLLVASVELGTLVAAVFVSFFGGRRRIPVWIGLGACLQGIGALMFVLPHVIAHTYTGGLRANVTAGHNICGASERLAAAGRRAASADPGSCERRGGDNGPYVMILVLAQTMVGVGGSPLFTLGTTYIDNHVSSELAPVYIAFLYAAAALGPVLGFGLGALMLQFYVDTFTFDHRVAHLTPADPQWVGAWWGGFIICGCLLLLTAVPFFGFPKALPRARVRARARDGKERREEKGERVASGAGVGEERRRPRRSGEGSGGAECGKSGGKRMEELATRHVGDEYGKDIKDLPSALWRLLTNPIFMVTSLGICCEIAIVSGFILFLPKYLETQFGLTKSFANLLTGGIAIPGAVFGILVGGHILKRFQLGAKGAVQLTLILNMSASTGFGVLLFLGCENVKMAGATTPYVNSSGHQFMQANLTSACNLHCACSPADIEPICGINHVTYFSPCHAGCTQLHRLAADKPHNYSDCGCIYGERTPAPGVSVSPMATRGPCRHTCDTLLPFMMMLFVMTFVVAGTQMPLLMTTLRSVAVEEKAFALGVQFVMHRVFAYIPAPILFGSIIDTTCILWEDVCGAHGTCLMYDIELFRYKYVGNSAGMKLVGAVFFGIVWLLIKRQEVRERHRMLIISATDQHTDGPSQPLRPIYNVAMGDATQAPPTPDWAVRYEPGRMSHESAL